MRLKRTFGEFGNAADITAVINAIGGAVNGVVNTVTMGKVLTTQEKQRAQIAIRNAIEGTNRLNITSQENISMANIGVQKIDTIASGASKAILVIGVVLSLLMLSGSYSYRTVSRGDRG